MYPTRLIVWATVFWRHVGRCVCIDGSAASPPSTSGKIHAFQQEEQGQDEYEPMDDEESELPFFDEDEYDALEEELDSEDDFGLQSQYQHSREHSSDLNTIMAHSLGILGTKIFSKQFLSFALSGAQFGICFYLAKAIWKAIVEVVDEFEQAENRANLQDEHDIPMLNEDVINSATESLSAKFTKETNKKDDEVAEKSNTFSSSIFASDIASRLHQSGLPISSMNPKVKTVQSVLKSLTRTEAKLLSSTLIAHSNGNERDLNKKQELLLNMWNNIGGLDDVKEGLMDIVFPLMDRSQMADMDEIPELHSSYYGGLLDNPPGVLLYGPPGCGKTLLVRALAGTANARFLNIQPSTLFRKYVGETNINVKALFTLARKVAPCIIFIDEIDALFRERRSGGGEEHEVNRELKTEFMQLWDGIQSVNEGIIVVGATNRPFDLDSAFLRRMPRSFFVGLPNDVARAKILTSMLNDVPKDNTFDMRQIIQATEFYTPSDIKEVLRTAALFPLREARGEILRRRQQGEQLSRVECMAPKLRPLRTTDVIAALHKVSPTPLSEEYKSALLGFASKASGRSMSTPAPHFPNQYNNFQNGMNPYSNQNFGQNEQNHGQYQMGNQNDYYVTNNVSPPSFNQMQGDWGSPQNFDEYDSYDESYDDSTYD